MKKPMDFAQTNLLLEQYINGTLQKYDLLFCLFGGNGREVPPQERSRFLLEYLHRVTETQNGGGAEYAVILHEVLSCKDPQTLAAFQKLLAQDWHERHEDIVTLLAECPSESSLPHLVKAFAFDPPYADRYPLQKKSCGRYTASQQAADVAQKSCSRWPNRPHPSCKKSSGSLPATLSPSRERFANGGRLNVFQTAFGLLR